MGFDFFTFLVDTHAHAEAVFHYLFVLLAGTILALDAIVIKVSP